MRLEKRILRNAGFPEEDLPLVQQVGLDPKLRSRIGPITHEHGGLRASHKDSANALTQKVPTGNVSRNVEAQAARAELRATSLAGEIFNQRSADYYRPLVDVINQRPVEKKRIGPLGLIVCVDGPSAAGKREFGQFLSNTRPNTAAIDGDLFLLPRSQRPLPTTAEELSQIPPHAMSIRNWHDLGKLKRNLDGLMAALANGDSEYKFSGAYKHDARGESDRELGLKLDFQTLVLTGRYALDPEVQEALRKYDIPVLKIIIDALPSERLQRVLTRAQLWGSRPVDQQRYIQTQIAEPDWRAYLPTIFGTADLYATTDGKLTVLKPSELIERSHVWGRYADLVTDPSGVYRMIEIGQSGRTSIHRHSQLKETYHVIDGPLEVQLGETPEKLEVNLLNKGDTITIPNGYWHSAGSYNGSQPLYYETVIPVNGQINPNDIEKAVPAKPMSGQLSVLHL
jgi:quercetin dioxygenase-like cupin family protein